MNGWGTDTWRDELFLSRCEFRALGTNAELFFSNDAMSPSRLNTGERRLLSDHFFDSTCKLLWALFVLLFCQAPSFVGLANQSDIP